MVVGIVVVCEVCSVGVCFWGGVCETIFSKSNKGPKIIIFILLRLFAKEF